MDEHRILLRDSAATERMHPPREASSAARGRQSALAGLSSAVLEFIHAEQLFVPGDRVLIGCSGGLDSTLLVRTLVRLQEQLELTLCICHVHHGLRGQEADDDASFVAALADEFQLPFHLIRLQQLMDRGPGRSLQEAAREARYQAMTALAEVQGYSRIALGHTASDQLETMVHHLARGAGLKGLGGIAPLRAPGIVRPFLEIPRKRLEHVATRSGLVWREDSSNSSRKYTRNRIRLDVLPTLRVLNPSVDRTIVYASRQLRREEALLSRMTDALLREPWIERTAQQVRLQRDALLQVDHALRARVLRKLLLELVTVPSELSSIHVEELLRGLEVQKGTRQLQLPGAAWAIISPHTVDLVRGGEGCAAAFQLRLDLEQPFAVPSCVKVQAGLLQSKLEPISEVQLLQAGPNRALFSLAALGQPLSIRVPRRGDRFWPWGRAGDTLLADFMIRQKIPLTQRQSWPLVASGDKILWVPGLRRSAWFPVDLSSGCGLLLTLVPSDVTVDEPCRENNPIPPDPDFGKEKQ